MSNQRQRANRTDNSITKLADGKGWRARPTLGTDPITGKQVRPTKVFSTKRDALEWVDEQRTQWRERTWAPKSDRSFDEAADHWIKVREADDSVRENTVRSDRDSLRYARSTLGAIPLQKLTPEALTDWSMNLTRRDGEPLAPATKRRAILTVQSVMGHAMTMKWITYDPSAHLKSPRQRVIVSVAEEDIWTPRQMEAFLDHVTEHRLSGCFALTMLGLRREEVGGLRWSDINFGTGVLHIRQARVDINGRDEIGDPKTERSRRDLPLPPRELAMLKAMKHLHKRERLAVGRPLTENDLLMSRIDGSWFPVKEYSRLFCATLFEAGLRTIPLRNVRHSSVSRMREAGIPADVVAAWHGHSERMTQAVYGRVSDDRLAAAADVLAKAVGQS